MVKRYKKVHPEDVVMYKVGNFVQMRYNSINCFKIQLV